MQGLHEGKIKKTKEERTPMLEQPAEERERTSKK